MAQILAFYICCCSDDDYDEYIERAFDCLKLAAEHGNALAQDYLGDCYYCGKQVAKNYNEAVKWYRKAAKQGLTSAQYCLGDCYYFGMGVAKNYNEAVKWYKKAAEQGLAFAQDTVCILVDIAARTLLNS